MTGYRHKWGERIRDARVAAGHSQRTLAIAMRVDQAQVSRWERGLALPRDDRRPALAALLGVSADDLFSYTNGDEDAAA